MIQGCTVLQATLALGALPPQIGSNNGCIEHRCVLAVPVVCELLSMRDDIISKRFKAIFVSGRPGLIGGAQGTQAAVTSESAVTEPSYFSLIDFLIMSCH